MKAKTKNRIMMGLTAASMGMAGYMYMKKNPNAINNMKNMANNIGKMTSEKLENMN